MEDVQRLSVVALSSRIFVKASNMMKIDDCHFVIRTKHLLEFSNSPNTQAVRLPLKFKYILTQHPTCVIN